MAGELHGEISREAIRAFNQDGADAIPGDSFEHGGKALSLRAYHDRLIELGVKNYSFGDCIDGYRWTLMFCLCYPVIGGGLGDPANERGVALGRAMTDRCVSAIRDWKAFEVLKP